MKKTLKIFSLILIAFCFIPLTVFASDGETEKLYINIDIKDNGDIFVQELATLEGTYNGRLRDVWYQNAFIGDFDGSRESFKGSKIYNGSGIENLKIYDVKGRNNITFDSIFDKSLRSEEYIRDDNAVAEYRGKYKVESETSSGYSLKIYNNSGNDTSFLMEYTIKNAVVVHNDVAELAWNILGDTYQDNIYDMEVHINLPGEDDNMRVFLHGPLNGNIHRYDNKYAKILYDFVGARNAVSARIVFNKELVPYATKMSNVDAFDTILDVEQEMADQANRERERIKRQNFIIYVLNIVYCVFTFLVIICCIVVKKKSNKTDFTMEYFRDIPADYGPEVLNYLISNNISTTAFSATILNLIDKKVIKTETLDKDNYQFILQDEYNKDLSEVEEKVVDMLFNIVGNGQTVTLKNIKDYGKTYSKAKKFMSAYNSYIRIATKAAKEEKFFKSMPALLILFIVLIFLLGFPLFFITLYFEIFTILTLIGAILVFILIIVISTLKLRSEKGALHYAKWMALKNFMKDFGTMNEKELPEISIWGKYLVYATVLGCANKLRKDMQIKIQNMNLTDSDLANYYLLNSYTDNVHATSYLVSSVNSAVQSAVSSSRSSIAASESSSGSGFGGGSSGGGGSFGGGGGGGHF